jgi:hypothetical protein
MSMDNNLRITEEYKEGERIEFYVERVNEKKPWPANSMIVFFVCEVKKLDTKKALKSYKILNIGTDKVKIVSLLDCDNIIYKSK